MEHLENYFIISYVWIQTGPLFRNTNTGYIYHSRRGHTTYMQWITGADPGFSETTKIMPYVMQDLEHI